MAETDFEAVFTQLAAIEAAISGIKATYVHVPEAVTVYPCCINYPVSGSLDVGYVMPSSIAGTGNADTIVVLLLVARGVLSKADKGARPYRDAFMDAITADPTLGGKVSTVKQIRYTYGTSKWAEMDHIGFRFELDVEMRRY